MRILFFCSSTLAMEVLSWIMDQNIHVAGVVGDSDVKDITISLGLDFLNVKQAEHIVDTIDLVISWLYAYKIEQPFINITRLGCINFHPAPLPEYRGRGGCNLAILNKEEKWGVTAHFISEDFDMGDIIKVRYFDFDYKNETAYSLKKKTNNELLDLYKDIIDEIQISGKPNGKPQNREEGRYLSKKNMLELMRINIQVDDIDNKIQAFWYPPFMGAYIEINGKKYTLVNEHILKTLTKD